mgnify:CR=1 FL=1
MSPGNGLQPNQLDELIGIKTCRKIKKGEVIKHEDIDYKRPGGAFDPGMTGFIVGRTVNKDLEYDHILTKEDII